MTESTAAKTKRIRAELIERWPDLFNVKKPVPLAIGIHAALLEAMPDITEQQLRCVLVGWCNHPRYLTKLTAGADRHGLEDIQGTVTEEAENRAVEQLKTLQAQAVEKAKAKRESEQAEQARQAEAKRMKAEREAKKAEKVKQAEAKKKNKEKEAKNAAPAPLPANPDPATAKPAGGPVIVVKKRRATPLADL
jgi:sRNA-binding protein